MSIKIINPSSSSSNTSTSTPQNLLINGAFDYWQRINSSGVFPVAPGTTQYNPDRWYINNTADVSNVNFLQSSAALIDGSIFGMSTAFDVGGNTTGNQELWQVLDNPTSQRLYNQSASFSLQIKALNNVTQVGLQFAYATSEIKPSTFISSEVLVSVNTSTFTLCKMENVAIGTSLTHAGVVGVRIRPTAVSSGNVYDALNGFFAQQGMLNQGTTVGSFQRAGLPEEELAMCQRFYAKTYDLTVNPATVTNTGTFATDASAFITANSVAVNWQYPVQMRATPTVTFYNPVTGGTTTWRNFGAGTNIGFVVPFAIGTGNVTGTNSATVTVGNFLYGHITADAEI